MAQLVGVPGARPPGQLLSLQLPHGPDPRTRCGRYGRQLPTTATLASPALLRDVWQKPSGPSPSPHPLQLQRDSACQPAATAPSPRLTAALILPNAQPCKQSSWQPPGSCRLPLATAGNHLSSGWTLVDPRWPGSSYRGGPALGHAWADARSQSEAGYSSLQAPLVTHKQQHPT